MENIITKLKVPKSIIRYIIMNFLGLKSIKKIMMITKKFNVLTSYEKIFFERATKGFPFCCKNGYLDEAKWIYKHHYLTTLVVSRFSGLNRECVELNKLDVSEWLMSIDLIKRNNIYEKTFIFCCGAGLLKHAKLIYSYKLKIEKNTYERAFLSASSDGHLETAKWLYSVYKIKNPVILESSINKSCSKDYVDVAKWIHSLGKIKWDQIEFFIGCCMNGNFESIKWIYSLGNINLNDDYIQNSNMYTNTCKKGYLDIMKWLNDKKKIEIDYIEKYLIPSSCSGGKLQMTKWLKSLGDCDIYCNNNKILYNSVKGININILKLFNIKDFIFDKKIIFSLCRNGNYNTIKYLHNNKNIILDGNIINSAFILSCKKNKIKIAKFLFSLGNIDIKKIINKIFILCCKRRNLDICKFLYLLEKPNINSSVGKLFSNHILGSKSKKSFQMAKWFFSIYEKEIKECNIIKSLFLQVCSEGKFKIAKWLYSLENIDIHVYGNRIFYNCCRKGYLKMAKWIYYFGSINVYSHNYLYFILSFKKKNFTIFVWLCKLNKIDEDISKYFKNSLSRKDMNLLKLMICSQDK